MTETAAATRIVYRSCNLCEAHCGVAVEVEPATARVLGVRGDADDPQSRGYICPKAWALKGLQEDPDRLRRPLIRRGGDFEEASWESALDFASERLRTLREAHGPNAIATYLGNPNAHDYAASIYLPTFQRALGTRWRFSATSVDQLPKTVACAGLYGHPGSIPVPDVDRTDHLLVLGANPLASNGSLMTAPDMPGRLRALRERGGKLVVVDPRRSETAEVADQHVFVRPGSDAHLLFAMVDVLFEERLLALGRLEAFTTGIDTVRALAEPFTPEAVAPVTGVEPDVVRALARELAAAPRAAVYGRIGTCTQEFGTLASWLVDVLNVLTGNLDRAGGVMFPRAAHEPADPTRRKRGRVPYARWRSRVRGLPEFGGELPVATLAEEITTPGEGRVRALVTVAGNPVLSTPNGDRLAEALEELEFMVSVDIYRNETTRFAHVILPTTTPLERSNYDLFFHQLAVRNGAKWSPPALEPPADARHGWQVLLELAARVNGTSAEALEEATLDALLGACVGSEKSACPELTPEAARERLLPRRGPERMLDLMLRCGPYGDRFDDSAQGLSLSKLQAEMHGLDLGALEPRLPELLSTGSGELELAPELLTQDVPRLRADLDARRARPRNGEMVLIGRRQMRTNNSWMHNIHALAKGKPRCTLLVSPSDAERLGLEPGACAKVRSRVGELEAPVEISDEMMPGVVSLPHGFGHRGEGVVLRVAQTKQPGVNSNRLTDEELLDDLSGNAVLNGIPVEVSAA